MAPGARFLSLVERWFWVLCIAAGVLGVLLPWPGDLMRPAIEPILLLMLFLTCLKISLGAVGVHLRRPRLLAWMLLLAMVLTPLAFYGATLLILPVFAVGVLIMIAMPGGMMDASLTEICGGDGSLALVGTGLTTLICPVTVPLLLYLLGVQPKNLSPDESALGLLLLQAGWLSLFVFVPPLLAAAVRRVAPRAVERLKPSISGLTILCLMMLIYIALARFGGGLRKPGGLESALSLLGWLFVVSGALHLIGYFLAGARRSRERIALSVNMAYMNNLLGLVFALKFFGEKIIYVLPAVLMEFTMHVWLAPLRRFGRRAVLREERATEADPPDVTGGAGPPPEP